jgi:hypothetical protein
MKRTQILALCLMSVGAAETAATTNPAGLTREEEHKKVELQNRLCADAAQQPTFRVFL